MMNPMLQKPSYEEPRVHLLCTDPDLKQAWLQTHQEHKLVVEKARAFAEKVNMCVEFYYSGLDLLEIRYLPKIMNEKLCKRIGFRTFAPRQVAAKGTTKVELLAFQEQFAAASEEIFGHGHPPLACRARQLAGFLDNPNCLNWPDCPNVYLVEEGVVFYGKRSGIEKYLSKLGLSVTPYNPETAQVYTHAEKGGSYHKDMTAKPAGVAKVHGSITVYHDTRSGQHYYRFEEDFNQNMLAVNVKEEQS